ncbi:MAG: hypothetical protein ACOYIF_08985 [Acetivibrionales bacterium]
MIKGRVHNKSMLDIASISEVCTDMGIIYHEFGSKMSEEKPLTAYV